MRLARSLADAPRVRALIVLDSGTLVRRTREVLPYSWMCVDLGTSSVAYGATPRRPRAAGSS